jgi:alkyl sulfatase BDS1-like metallo-beta-lactamase superfamily hydrolase
MNIKQTASTATKDAEPSVRFANQRVLETLPFEDRQDFADAARGFIGTCADATIRNARGRTVWSLEPYGFLRDETAPATVNPSLWRQARLNMNHGLYHVVDGVYQVRGFDIANMTLVEADTGLIVIDTLTCAEGARAALELYFQHRPRRPIAAVIYTHTHADHWGGVKGVIDEADVRSGRIPVLAPDLFMEHAVSENVIAGNVMIRRAQYQFGPLLPKGVRGQVDCGLGKDIAGGSVTLIAPTDLIRATGERRVIDGVEIEFQMAPESEAPAEFHLFFPKSGVLNMAENAVHNFHNLLPFRGALVRDPLNWSKYINEALQMWGDRAEVLIGQHHWPVWGKARVKTYLEKQRDIYKYVHDQTVRLMNQGSTPAEIAETIELPRSLAREWPIRGYYGHIRHNVKAIYQRYLGWYDGNPANLDPLPPIESGKKYVEYMGGAAAAVARARQDFARGEYRWVAQVMSHVVFADPANAEARGLLADAFEQLGYLAESATWRNAYLFGAHELRHGMPQLSSRTPVSAETIQALATGQFFDYLAVRLDGPRAEGKRAVLNWRFTDTGEQYVLTLDNSALTYVANRQAAEADATLTLRRRTLDMIITERQSIGDALGSGEVAIAGDGGKVAELFSLVDPPRRMFEIVEPKQRQA